MILLKKLRVSLFRVSLHYHFQPSIVFDTLPSFISSEQAQACNIKNRVNRQCVERALRMFNSNLKRINSIPDNGVIYCFGTDEHDVEIFQGIIPPNPVDKFYYKCDRYFHLEQYEKLFEQKPMGYVVFIDGNECIIYQYNGIWTRLKYFDALLIKRQRKGGQSSVRFSRLAEESRMHYIIHIVDEVNTIITDTKSVNYVFGGEELKMMFMANSSLKPKFKTESLYHTFNRDTIHDPYFLTIMNKVDNDYTNQISQQIITYIDTKPELLLFSLDEIIINIKHVEYIFIISNDMKQVSKMVSDKTCYYLNIDNPLFGRFKGFDIIGKLYYKLNTDVVDTDEVLFDTDAIFV